MPPLNPALRNELEKAVLRARGAAEDAARAALSILAVDRRDAFSTLSEEQRAFRRALRAKARQLGGYSILVDEVAYAQWHRMLFARFLAENDLLMHPEKHVAVTLDECEELAAVEDDPDQWVTATRYAGEMLPGIFSPDDPTVDVSFAPEGRAALDAILTALPRPVFTSDDGLGWVYQFWQSKRKKQVSGSGRKIEKLDLAAYSQLFTEDYMVRFLLENSLGAWWAARRPDSSVVKGFEYLRVRDDGTPAAGTFPGWPERAAGITVMDPSCGSGHFLIVAFDMLRRMRMEEEGLGAAEAAVAVLRDNLFGLEIDPRCVQIAAFALALAAWKAGGYRELPLPNVACSGMAVRGQLEAWTVLARDDVNIRRALERLHAMFVNAPDLGSLIDPAGVPVRERMFAPDFEQVGPLLERALARERADDPVATVFGNAALGVARAADLLARQYTLVATNVPYLARGKQGDSLKEFIELRHGEAKADLATAFMERCRSFCLPGGTCGLVTPQNWLFLTSYAKLRKKLLREQEWHIVARLGPSAFQTIGGAVVNVALVVASHVIPDADSITAGINASQVEGIDRKALLLAGGQIDRVPQQSQLRNPDSRITLQIEDASTLLSVYAKSFQGIATADYPRYGRCYRPWLEGVSEAFQAAVSDSVPDGYEAASPPEVSRGTCLLFVDGLRFDLGQRLGSLLGKQHIETEIEAVLTALPTVTSTAKPATSPAASLLRGGEGFDTTVEATGSKVNASVLRRAIADEGFQILGKEDLGDPTGCAWSEYGAIDAHGHEHGWRVAHHVGAELKGLGDRIVGLLDHGWQKVVVVTDHGWLLMPGGLPKADLPEHLTELRKGRCARLKEGSQTVQQVVPWHWHHAVRVAMAPGIHCYEAGKEYEHGGLSPQECVVPILSASKQAPRLKVSIGDVKWRRLRCNVEVQSSVPRLRVDIRTRGGDPSTTLANGGRELGADGKASLLVEDEDREDEAALIVVVGSDDAVLEQTSTIVGGP